MPNPDPIHEHQASPETSAVFLDIKETLKTGTVPIMFKYMANYPEYFKYLWTSIQANLKDETFTVLMERISHEVLAATANLVSFSPQSQQSLLQLIPDATERNRIAEDIRTQFELQCKLAFITVAIREATKGWAIGAKYLTSEQAYHAMPEAQSDSFSTHTSGLVLAEIAESSTELAHQPHVGKPMMSFIVFLHEDFADIIRKDSYVFTRVATEQSLTRYLSEIPHRIQASYNEVSALIPDPQDLSYLFYLLSEKFPTVNTIACLMWGYGYRLLER